ncbi:hypothetical protein PoB_002281100 [Plakobranchus ocellatus]|uniref:Uncharacterized protein n=1 Tax=Plakobranchus ocellatus TaxID=259542 RepID=A0AAV3ZAJ7_9GAST|nr:hypothetical protein PoB_002281100 [Plakobranchus ocellatus]
MSSAKDYLQRHLQRLEFLRTEAAARIAANNNHLDTTKDHGQKLHVGDIVLLSQHPPGRNKLQARYHDKLVYRCSNTRSRRHVHRARGCNISYSCCRCV